MEKIELRDYQKEAIEAFKKARGNGVENRFLLTAAVGAGKTIITSQIMSEESRQHSGKTLFLVHRDELIRQTVNKAKIVDPTLTTGVIQGKEDEWEGVDIVVASVQSISRRLNRYPSDMFSLIIVDETHRVTAASYRKTLEYFGCFDDKRKTTLLGITATAKRTDGVSLSEIYQRHIFDIGMLELIERGALSPLRALVIETDTNLAGVKKQMGDFNEKQLASILNTTNRNELIAKAVREHAADRKMLVFCVNIAHAQALSTALQAHRINSACIHGKMSPGERKSTLEAFSRGEYQALTTVQLLVEGYDEPSVDCVVWATATMSLIKYTQGIGRGTRLSPQTGKTDCLVIDFANNSGKHSLMSVSSLFGVGEAGRKALQEGKTVNEAVEIDEAAKKVAEEAACRKALEEAERAKKPFGSGITVRVVDLFGKKQEMPVSMTRSPYDWLKINENRYMVPLFDEQVHIRNTGDTWHAVTVDHNNSYRYIKSLGESRSIEDAVKNAEAYLKRNYKWVIGTMRKWKAERPSAGQLSAFRRCERDKPANKKDAFLAISLSIAQNYFRRYSA